jgi:hypothetical protein
VEYQHSPFRFGVTCDLNQLLPQVTTIGFLLNPKLPQAESQASDVQEAARALNLQVHILRASTDHEIDSTFETIALQRIQALAVGADPFFDTRREKIVALAARHGVPTMYHFREFAVAGVWRHGRNSRRCRWWKPTWRICEYTPKMSGLILKRGNASRSSGQWSDDDYDVLSDAKVVGRIFKDATSTSGKPWFWGVAYGYAKSEAICWIGL